MKGESAWWVRALHPVMRHFPSGTFYKWCDFRFRHTDRRRPTDEFEPPPRGAIPTSNEARRGRRPLADSTVTYPSKFLSLRIEHEKELGFLVRRPTSRETAEQARVCRICGASMKLGIDQRCAFRGVSDGKCEPAHLPTCEFHLPSGSCDCGLSQNSFNAYVEYERTDPTARKRR